MSDDLVRVGDIPELSPLVRATQAAIARGEGGLLIVSETNFAWCYMNNGIWIAECPTRCGNAELMFDGTNRRDYFLCSNCKALFPSVRWPSEGGHDAVEAISEVLNRRPNPLNRNWYPAGHPTAVSFRVVNGQTVQDLIDENHANGID